ncbi:hypothetical protein [Flavisphingomonas formosensis]|uniref:hypothetical protein n=1 Tax=Flavisphingomonas formosensis TaxID=861534 RepID=UPI0012F8DA87|nr:hypothetical protein [Sphingomonas formosensis]
MKRAALTLACAAALLLTGCVVRTAAKVATAPVRVVGKGVDWTTTSREEADRNRGRAMRKQEERAAKARRKEEKDARKREREEERAYP